MDYNGEIIAKFLMRSQFLSMSNNVTKSSKLTMGPFRKYAICIMAFFTPFNFVTLRQLYSNTSPVIFTKLH